MFHTVVRAIWVISFALCLLRKIVQKTWRTPKNFNFRWINVSVQKRTCNDISYHFPRGLFDSSIFLAPAHLQRKIILRLLDINCFFPMRSCKNLFLRLMSDATRTSFGETSIVDHSRYSCFRWTDYTTGKFDGKQFRLPDEGSTAKKLGFVSAARHLYRNSKEERREREEGGRERGWMEKGSKKWNDVIAFLFCKDHFAWLTRPFQYYHDLKETRNQRRTRSLLLIQTYLLFCSLTENKVVWCSTAVFLCLSNIEYLAQVCGLYRHVHSTPAVHVHSKVANYFL